MALPMVHLLAAQLFAQDKPELSENPDYYLGAISPDAIHIRDGDDKSHKNAIHLNNWRMPDERAVLDYWAEHHTPFDIGYGIHVLLDGQWALRFRERFPEMLLPNGKPDPDIYYNDCLSTDFALYHSSEQTPFFMRMLAEGQVPQAHPLLTPHELDGWRQATLTFYDRPCPRNAAVRFLTTRYVEGFLHECQALMTKVYERSFTMNETQRSILERRSTRGFSKEALSEAQMQNLMDAALASPTACNYQDWNFIFVRNQALLTAFSAEYRELMTARLAADSVEQRKFVDYDLFFGAPLVVFITLPKSPKSRFAEVDAGIAVENLALAAQGMGLGSVILGRPKEVIDGANGASWERRLGFADGHRYAIAIAIGHPTVGKEAHPIGEGKLRFVD